MNAHVDQSSRQPAEQTEQATPSARGARALSLHALAGVPLVQPGDDLAALVLAAAERSGLSLHDGDVLVLAQKIVSKAEGRLVPLASVQPSARALELAPLVNKDARLVELVLRESREVVRYRRDVLIVEHRLGFVMANAGIDQSNVRQDTAFEQADARAAGAADAAGATGDVPGESAPQGWALLLPEDPDASCAALRGELRRRCGADLGIVINDSHGRAWHNGTVGVAIGAAGLPALLDLRGAPDLYGRRLQITEVGLADELASAASLLMGQAAEGAPVVLVRGLAWPRREGSARELVRPRQMDLFR